MLWDGFLFQYIFQSDILNENLVWTLQPVWPQTPEWYRMKDGFNSEAVRHTMGSWWILIYIYIYWWIMHFFATFPWLVGSPLQPCRRNVQRQLAPVMRFRRPSGSQWTSPSLLVNWKDLEGPGRLRDLTLLEYLGTSFRKVLSKYVLVMWVVFPDVPSSPGQFDSMTVPQLKEKAKEALSQWKLAETGYSWNQLEKVGDKTKFLRLDSGACTATAVGRFLVAAMAIVETAYCLQWTFIIISFWPQLDETHQQFGTCPSSRI